MTHAVDSHPGYFHCLDCNTDYPDAIYEAHVASHAAEPATEDPITGRTMLFWLFCLAVGGVVGSLVANIIS